MARRFGSAAAFKASLEASLRKLASERRVPLSTLQLKFAIERLLARLFHSPAPPWLLKGGFAMDLRFRPHARTTKDVDLGVPLASAGFAVDFSGALRDQIQEAVDVDLQEQRTISKRFQCSMHSGLPTHSVPDSRHNACYTNLSVAGLPGDVSCLDSTRIRARSLVMSTPEGVGRTQARYATCPAHAQAVPRLPRFAR